MRNNDQFSRSIIFTLTIFAACQPMPDDPGKTETTGGQTSAVETDGASETGAPTTGSSSGSGDDTTSSTGDCSSDACTRCDALANECQNTPGCDVEAVLEACGQLEIHCGCPVDTSGSGSPDGSTSETCFAGNKPKPGELYGKCKGPNHECDEGLTCQVANDPDPQFPKGTMCLTTCWGEGNDGTCPEALDSCGETFAKTACQSATDPGREVPCLLPCTDDIDCGNEGMRCWLDRCVWEGL